ncbi:hypothetical protein PYCCODRAFT_1408692 [Trametes coccinea BRFM310]|uniref:polynucleotide adenylyltransferase n=1 Tax=Trametes coccinea (strain BRFM310) TaxID=1353009 RepID=A0A1Y2IUP1_TRAC3|nr:hypothetical protein PYCCODRAFT_1408692 [Trametes coccinea BRFM310]
MATSLASPSLSSSSAQPSPRQQFLDPNSPPQQHRRLISRQRFINDFSQCLYEFVIQLLPTAEEMAVKEDVRKLLERLIRTIEPDSRLLSFGSSANGFSLKNSDMDLCCLIDSGERLNASDLVTMVGDLLERETKFHVKPLPHARIPIVKLTLDPSPALPFGIACDIGFENRLALENTRLLMCYASIDPARVRTMVLFLKVWSKRRKINSPYKGTLSSYGYVLLVIYFLVHVKNPPVLPNLQQMPPLRPISEEETHLNGYNIWFFDDIELLRQRWKSSNTETVAELLIDFFRFYSRDFAYNTGVASIRAGLLKKETKGWFTDDHGTGRERNRLCIEDPFETDFNVARCVTKDGLYTIRGEFMRASRILQARPDRAILALAQLCEERKDETLGPPPPKQRAANGPPRLTSIPPQTPYTVGSSPMRPNIPVPAPEEVASPRLPSQGPSSPASPSPLSPRDAPGRSTVSHSIPLRLPVDKLDHMAPIRGKWTSPPPPEAPEEDRSAYEDRLGQSLALATASNSSRLSDNAYASSNNSETHTDDERQSIAESDDVRSVKSYVEEGAVYRSREWRDRHLAGMQNPQRSIQQQYGIEPSISGSNAAYSVNSRMEGGVDVKMMSRLRGRPASRLAQQASANIASVVDRHAQNDRNDGATPPPRMDTPRRSMSFPVRNVNRFSLPTMPVVVPNHLAAAAYQTHVSPPMQYTAPRYVLQTTEHSQANGNVYYEAVPPRERDRLYRAMATRSNAQAQHAAPQSQFERISSYNGGQSRVDRSRRTSRSRSRSSSRSPTDVPITIRRASVVDPKGEPVAGPSRLPEDSPLSPTSEHARDERTYSHRHSHSNTTITAPTPPANVHHFPAAVSGLTLGPRHAQSHSQSHSRSRSPPFLPTQRSAPHPYQYAQPQHASPPMSCASSQYAATSSPLSTSPPSPAQSETKGVSQTAEAAEAVVSPLKTSVPLLDVPAAPAPKEAVDEQASAVEVAALDTITQEREDSRSATDAASALPGPSPQESNSSGMESSAKAPTEAEVTTPSAASPQVEATVAERRPSGER